MGLGTAILIVAGILVLDIVYIVFRSFKAPKNSPENYLKSNPDKEKKVIVCVGDSITHGNIGTNYVNMINN